MAVRHKVVELAINDDKLSQAGIARLVGVTGERVRQILIEENLYRPRQLKIIIPSPPKPSKYATYVCEWCGKSYERKISAQKRTNHWFCSRLCFGKWLGNNYGFGVHPENMKHTKKEIVEMNENSSIKFEVISKKDALLGGSKQLDRAVIIVQAVLELKNDQALRIQTETSQMAESLAQIIRRRLANLGYKCEVHVRKGNHILVYDVRKTE